MKVVKEDTKLRIGGTEKRECRQ